MKPFHISGIVLICTFLSHQLAAIDVGRPWDSPHVSLAQESTGREATTPGTATSFVSPSGDNSNPGTREAPWATPGYGSRHIQSGDTLVILGGRYSLSVFDADIISPPSGTADAWTTILGEEGNRPVLAGSGNLYSAMVLSGRSYVQIENLEITSDGGALFRDGITAVGEPISNVVLRDLSIHHIDEFGIDIGDANRLLIAGCEISWCGFGAIGGPAGIEGGWRNVDIVGCRLSYSGHYYQGGAGPGPYDRPDGFGIEPSSGPIEIVRTIAEHNRGDGIDSKAQNTYIHRCTVANNRCDGVKLWGSGSRIEDVLIYGRGDGDTQTTPWAAIVIDTGDSGADFEIVNVTVDDSLGNNYLMYVQYDNPNTPVTLGIVNSIFCGRGENSPIFLAGSVDLSIGYNLFYMPNSSTVLQHGSRGYDRYQIGDLGKRDIYGDPLFFFSAFGTDGDYHLQDGSPGIDAGSSIFGSPVDLDGIPRPQGDGCDIGCYERSGAYAR